LAAHDIKLLDIQADLFYLVVTHIIPILQSLGHAQGQNPLNLYVARNGMMDTTLLSAILFHAGVHLDSIRKQPWSASTIYHLGESIRGLNENLSSSVHSKSDHTIAAVALLAGTGVRFSKPLFDLGADLH
jgi:hypothetical protein